MCCVLSGRGLCDGLITHPEESYPLCCVVQCDLETSRMRRPWPTGGLLRQKNERRHQKPFWNLHSDGYGPQAHFYRTVAPAGTVSPKRPPRKDNRFPTGKGDKIYKHVWLLGVVAGIILEQTDGPVRGKLLMTLIIGSAVRASVRAPKSHNCSRLHKFTLIQDGLIGLL